MEKLVIMSFFLINPILGFIGIPLLKNKRKAFFLLLSLLFAYYGFCIPITFELDLSRHYEFFDEIIVGNFDLESSRYFGMYILCYIIKFLSLPRELLPFISLFLTYYISFNIYSGEIAKNRHINLRDEIFIYLFVICNLIHYVNIYSGIRFPIAMILSFYGIYKKENKEIGKIKFLLIFLLALSFHKFIIVIYIIYFISFFLKINCKIEEKVRVLIFGLLFFLSFNEELFTKIFSFIPDEYQLKYGMKSYMLGEGSSEQFGFGGGMYSFGQKNIIGKIEFIISEILKKYFYIFYVFVNKNIDNFLLTLTYIVLLFYRFETFSTRYIVILSYFLMIYIIRRYREVNTIYFEILTLFNLTYQILLIKNKVWFFLGIKNFIFSVPILKLLGID